MHEKSILKGLIALSGLALISLQSVLGQAITLPQDREKFHIFLLMGQSNMEGSRSIDGPMDQETHPRILKLNSWNSWELAKEPLTDGLEIAIGPGMSFAKKLAGEEEDITIGLVPLAVGGTHLSQWSKGAKFYNATLQAAAVARQYGVIKGILWHQGEHDGIFYSEASTYATRLAQLEDDLRKDLRIVDLPFITGGLVAGVANSGHHWAPLVGDQIWQNAAQTYLTGYVTTSDLPYLSDYLHFTTASQRILGERYCDEYLRVSGYWTAKAKEQLDDEAQVMEGGWKYHPSIGLYYDAYFPIVKHAQLGWVVMSYNADGSFSIDSKYYGKLRSALNPPPHGLYLYRENPNPELSYLPGTYYYVNLLANENTQHVIFNHTTGTWSRTIDDTPDLNTINKLYAAAEKVFGMTQQSSAEAVNAAFLTNWGDVREKLKETEENRMLMILYTFDAYRYANQHLTGNQAQFWRGNCSYLLSFIDQYLFDAQVQYQNFVNRL